MAPTLLLQKYPKSTIDIYITVIEQDGFFASIAGAVNCASLALADAGLEMKDVVCSTSLIINKNLDLIMDATEEEEDNSMGYMVFAALPSINEVSATVFHGEKKCKEFQEIVEVGMETCSKIYPIITECLVESFALK